MAVLNNNTLAGSSGQTTGGGGYEIERSLRFNSADSAYLSKNFGSAGNRKTWTWAGWVKKSGLGSAQLLFARHTASNDAGFDALYFNSSDILVHSGWTSTYFNTTQVFRDPSAWLHVVWVVDVTQSTGSNRNKLYINGSLISDYSAYNDLTENADRPINDAALHKIGGRGDALNLNGYLADVHFIDGQALDPTSFGEFDDNGVWQPIEYSGSYNVGVGAVNGFHLDFADNSSAAALGTDAAGSNDWTPNNFSVTEGAGNDSLRDSPTNGNTANDTGLGGELAGNYCTWNPLANFLTLSNGNLDVTQASAAFHPTYGTFGISSGKWYWEITKNDDQSNVNTSVAMGIVGTGNMPIDSSSSFNTNNAHTAYLQAGTAYYDNLLTPTPTSSNSSTVHDAGVWMFAYDLDNNKGWVGKNGVWFSPGLESGGDPANGTNPIFTNFAAGQTYVPMLMMYTITSLSANFGQRPFAYSAPSGFKALCTANLPDPDIADGSTAFEVITYQGNGTTQTLPNTDSTTSPQDPLEFSPDLVWYKCRSSGSNKHGLFDVIRGVTKQLYSDSTSSEQTYSGVTAFNSDGFSLGNDNGGNESSQTYVAWTWDAGSSTVSNTDGSVTSSVRANPTAGFSIVAWSSITSKTYTIGHGLNVKPSLVIAKTRNGGDNWVVYTDVIDGSYDEFLFNTTGAKFDSGGTNFTSTVFNPYDTANSAGLNGIAYCFAPVEGYSAFGSYTGNGSSTGDGPFVFCNFRPKWVLIKGSTTSDDNWKIYDSSRSINNVTDDFLSPDDPQAEVANNLNRLDFLSNGFKIRTEGTYALNVNNATFIWAAFAENPFKYARAR